MDRREYPPQLPPRNGSGSSTNSQLPPRPAPPLPPRRGPPSTRSTPYGGDVPNNTDRYRQSTVADDLSPDALEDVISGFSRLQTTPDGHTRNPNPPQQSPNHSTSTYSGSNASYVASTPSKNNNIPISDLITSRSYTSRSFLRECPERDRIKFPALWYYPSHAKAFTICSHCYNTIIRGSESRCGISFGSFTGTKHQTLYCLFGRPHPTMLFKTDNFQALKTFMASRAALRLSTCHGTAGVNANLNTTWYRPTNGDIDGMVCCQACYEDYVANTSFSSRFKRSAPQPAGQVWACDIAVRYVRRTLEACSDSRLDHWRQFVVGTTHRLTVPPCTPYRERPANSTRWYHFNNILPGFVICEACYLDWIATTCMERPFTAAGLTSGRQQQQNLTCTLGYMPVAIALQEAIFEENFQLWYEVAKIFMNEDLCEEKFRTGTNYKLVTKASESEVDFNMCTGCYTSYIEMFGFGKHFKKVNSSSHYPSNNTEWMCDFHPSRHGFSKYALALSEAIFTGEFDITRDFIIRYQGIAQPCPRSNFVTGRRWYGTADFSACPDCFEETIQGTELESMITIRNELKQAENSCDIYSPRMRGLWREACQGNDYAGFVELVRHRTSVYWQTVPQMKRLLQQQRMSLLQQRTLNSSSSLYQTMDMAAASNSINYSGLPQAKVTYGAADVGYGYISTWGIEAERLRRQSQSLVSSSGSIASQVAYLGTFWEAIE